MSAPQKFRSAFNGFNREDVVRYLEYINNKHTTEINQLNSEADFLRAKLQSARPDETQVQTIAALEQEREELRARVEELQAQLDALTAEQTKAESVPGPMEELEAYRRAERAERVANERAELVYHQANQVIGEASLRINELADQVIPAANQAMEQLTALQDAIHSGKQALQDAATIVSTLRPNN